MKKEKEIKKVVYSKSIRAMISDLPFFCIEDLVKIGLNGAYLKVLLSRFVKRGEIIRLKRGVYASKNYLNQAEKENKINSYIEFIANNLYEPSYLSMEYVLAERGILTENVNAISSLTRNKTKKLLNRFGVFNYHNIKEELFCGFLIYEKNGFLISKASLAKALFDFLFFRKNIIPDKKAFLALRLNVENLSEKDRQEFKKYIKIAGSIKMKNIADYL